MARMVACAGSNVKAMRAWDLNQPSKLHVYRRSEPVADGRGAPVRDLRMVLVCVAGAATLLAGLSGLPASARPLRQIDVFPGPNALTNALAEARPGHAL